MERCARSMVMLGLLLAGAGCSSERAPVPSSAPCPPLVPPVASAVAATPEAPVILDAAARKRHRLELLIAQIDPVLHGVRLGYRPEARFGWGWTWPSYLELAHLSELVVELERRARELPALGALDEAVSRYGRETLEVAVRLHALVVRATPAEAEPGGGPPRRPGPDEVQPLFDRLGTGSRAIGAAFRAAPPLPSTPSGSRFTLERRCLDAVALVVDIPSATAEASPSGPARALDLGEFRARARTCLLAAVDAIDTSGADFDAADLALGVGTSLVREVDRLRAGGPVSWAGNSAQSMQYLAERGVKALDATP